MSPFSLLFSLAFLYAAIFVGSTEALLNMFEGKNSSATSSSNAKTGAVATVTKSAPTAAAATSSKAVAAAQATSTVVSPLGSASDVFLEGGACKASWIPASGSNTTWQNMTIDLMTGSNLQMVKLATVAANIDGTDPKVTSYLYACPAVSPNAAIYFLQYTHDNGQDPTWTTRFAIADANGNTTAPTNANQPQGGSPAIPWGTGQLQLTTTDDTAASPSPTSAAKGSAQTPNSKEMQSAYSSIYSDGSRSPISANQMAQQDGSVPSLRWSTLSLALPLVIAVVIVALL